MVARHELSHGGVPNARDGAGEGTTPQVLGERTGDDGQPEGKRMDVPAQPTRATTWRQLVREGPPSVLAEMLGISAATAMGHAELAGADFLRYARPDVNRATLNFDT